MDKKDELDSLRFYKSLQIQTVNYILILQGAITGLKTFLNVNWKNTLIIILEMSSIILFLFGVFIIFMYQMHINEFAKRAKGSDPYKWFEKYSYKVTFWFYVILNIIALIIVLLYLNN